MAAPLMATLIATLAAILLMAPACATAQAQDRKIDPALLVRERCVTCHDSRRICRMLGARDRLGWFETVARMVKNGARLSPAETEAVASHLAGSGKNEPGLCQ
jgi:hypothetical protein